MRAPMARRAPPIPPTMTLLAGLVPLVAYVLTAAPLGYWFDSGEFVATAVDFGISHPPGQALSGLLFGFARLVPLGALAFKVALVSAACTAGAAAALFVAIVRTEDVLGVPRRPVGLRVALGATWAVAGSSAWWFQAVRPEVYGPQALLVCVALERLIAFESRPAGGPARPLYQAALVLGLAIANHHFLALLLLPVGAVALARFFSRRPLRRLLTAFCFGALGVGVFLYLPLRAAARPFLDLGDPTTLSRFFWVVSARTFQRNVGNFAPRPLPDRFAEVATQLIERTGVVWCLLALAGLYFALRYRRAWRVGWLWVATLLIYGAARAFLGFVYGNPDALGYLMPAFAATGALAACLLGPTLTLLSGPVPGTARHRLAGLCALAIVAGGLWQFPARRAQSSLAHFTDTDAFADGVLRDVPAGAVVLLHNPESIFLAWGVAAEQGARPDVTLVPLPLLTYPGLADRLERERPAASELLARYAASGRLDLAALDALAANVPVLVEMDPRVPPALYPHLLPRSLYHAVERARVVPQTRVMDAIRGQILALDALAARVRGDPIGETDRQLPGTA